MWLWLCLSVYKHVFVIYVFECPRTEGPSGTAGTHHTSHSVTVVQRMFLVRSKSQMWTDASFVCFGLNCFVEINSKSHNELNNTLLFYPEKCASKLRELFETGIPFTLLGIYQVSIW